MPLEPADPRAPARRLDEPPGFSGWIPIALGIGALMFLAAVFAFCASAGETLDATATPDERAAAEVAGRLSTRDALLDASRAQEKHHDSHGAYTTDFTVLTAEGFYEGVSIEPVQASADEFCVMATHSSGIVRHITQADARPRPGPCG